MPQLCFKALRRTLCWMVGIGAAVQIAPCMAQQGNDPANFARRTVGTSADFPASSGRFAGTRGASERSGPPAELNASVQSAGWRLCRQCGYNGEDPKPFKAVGLRASFQPLGGTFSYHF